MPRGHGMWSVSRRRRRRLALVPAAAAAARLTASHSAMCHRASMGTAAHPLADSAPNHSSLQKRFSLSLLCRSRGTFESIPHVIRSVSRRRRRPLDSISQRDVPVHRFHKALYQYQNTGTCCAAVPIYWCASILILSSIRTLAHLLCTRCYESGIVAASAVWGKFCVASRINILTLGATAFHSAM